MINFLTQWTPNGDSFKILSVPLLEQTLLPIYFRHSNFPSLVGQLYNYNFRKTNKERNFAIYYHPLFHRDNESDLKNLRRKTRLGVDGRSAEALALKRNGQFAENELGNGPVDFKFIGDDSESDEDINGEDEDEFLSSEQSGNTLASLVEKLVGVVDRQKKVITEQARVLQRQEGVLQHQEYLIDELAKHGAVICRQETLLNEQYNRQETIIEVAPPRYASVGQQRSEGKASPNLPGPLQFPASVKPRAM